MAGAASIPTGNSAVPTRASVSTVPTLSPNSFSTRFSGEAGLG